MPSPEEGDEEPEYRDFGNGTNATDIEKSVIVMRVRHDAEPAAISGRNAGSGEEVFPFKGAEISRKFDGGIFVVGKCGEGGANVGGGAFERCASFCTAPADFGIVTAGGDGDEVSRFLSLRAG